MKHHLLWAPLLAVALTACDQKPVKSNVPVEPAPSAASAAAPTAAAAASSAAAAEAPKADALSLVRALAQNPSVLTQSWANMSALFPGCQRPQGSNDLSCAPITGLKLASVQDGGLGIIDLELTAPLTCDSLYQAVQAELGVGEVGSDKCDVRWKLAPKVKGGYASISNDSKAPERIFFQLAIEQGP
ncbi:hypothetical protein ACG0Z6_02725 [Roseateles sp. BYS180W]|uniref:Uncharacterized protein n=1 Tax=Roseateles rivi TaxID=3299028 RepID=A0ABW7FS45_9BURK